MSLILIEQTNNCQLKCFHCPNRLRQRPRGYMKNKDFKNIIDQLLEHYPDVRDERVALHGVGEPFLSPDLWKNLDYLQENSFRNADFSTNGLAMTKRVVDKLVKYGCLFWIRVSLNSSRGELMERLNTGTDFDVVVRNTKYLLEAVRKAGDPFDVVIQKMITGANEDETREEFEKLLGRDNFHYMEKRLHSYHHQTEGSDLCFPDVDQSKCVFGAVIYVHWDGDLVGCCADDTKTQVYGNAIKDGIFSEKVQIRRRELNRQLQKRDFSNLPFCKICLGL